MTQMTDKQLIRSIKSYEEKLNLHKDKIAKPEKYSPDWGDIIESHKQGRMRLWGKEIKNFEEKLALAIAVAKERGI